MIESEIFRALGDPTRRALFERLASRELSVRELSDGLPVSQPAVSQHVAVLKSAGLLEERREGRFTYYRATPDGLEPLTRWAERYRAFWPERVEILRDVLKEIE